MPVLYIWWQGAGDDIDGDALCLEVQSEKYVPNRGDRIDLAFQGHTVKRDVHDQFIVEEVAYTIFPPKTSKRLPEAGRVDIWLVPFKPTPQTSMKDAREQLQSIGFE